MKKYFTIIMLVITMLILVSCGTKDKAIGTWYSVAGDELIVIDNKRFQSEDMTLNQKCDYESDGNTYIFYDLEDLENTFEYVEKDGDATLVDKESSENIYFTTKEKSEEKRKELEAAEIVDSSNDIETKSNVSGNASVSGAVGSATAKAESTIVDTESIIKNLIGQWENDGSAEPTLEFLSDGTMKFKNTENHEWKYEVVSATELKITKENNEVVTENYNLSKSASGYSLKLFNLKYAPF